MSSTSTAFFAPSISGTSSINISDVANISTATKTQSPPPGLSMSSARMVAASVGASILTFRDVSRSFVASLPVSISHKGRKSVSTAVMSSKTAGNDSANFADRSQAIEAGHSSGSTAQARHDASAAIAANVSITKHEYFRAKDFKATPRLAPSSSGTEGQHSADSAQARSASTSHTTLTKAFTDVARAIGVGSTHNTDHIHSNDSSAAHESTSVTWKPDNIRSIEARSVAQGAAKTAGHDLQKSKDFAVKPITAAHPSANVSIKAHDSSRAQLSERPGTIERQRYADTAKSTEASQSGTNIKRGLTDRSTAKIAGSTKSTISRQYKDISKSISAAKTQTTSLHGFVDKSSANEIMITRTNSEINVIYEHNTIAKTSLNTLTKYDNYIESFIFTVGKPVFDIVHGNTIADFNSNEYLHIPVTAYSKPQGVFELPEFAQSAPGIGLLSLPDENIDSIELIDGIWLNDETGNSYARIQIGPLSTIQVTNPGDYAVYIMLGQDLIRVGQITLY